MMRHVFAVASALALLVHPATAQTPPACKLEKGFGIGCYGNENIGPQNAADLFSMYGFNREKFDRASTPAYLSRFHCFRILDKLGTFEFVVRGQMYVAEPNDEVRTLFVSTENTETKSVFWIATPYLNSSCIRPKKPSS